jgi:ribosome recycling factor
MQKSFALFEEQLSKIHSTTVSPALIDIIKVEYYGSMTPIGTLGFSNPIKNGISILLSDNQVSGKVVDAIKRSGFSAYSSGKNMVVVSSAPICLEEKAKVVKQIKKFEEEAKISIRNIRKKIRQGLPEEELKKQEKFIQSCTDEFISKIDKTTRVRIESL